MKEKDISKKLIKIKYNINEYIYLSIINNYKYLISNKFKDNYEEYKNSKKIILTLLPSHGNLGDHAIAYASHKFLKDSFPNYEIIELDMFEIYKYGQAIKNILNDGDFIVTIGGGNMNNLYRQEEWTRRFIINTFKNTPIISLPQTIAFTNDNKGQRELNKSKKIYSKNKKLTIMARENKSYEIMKNVFTENKVLKSPDMVFYLENLKLNRNFERKNILVCLRKDKEGFIGEKAREDIINTLKNNYENVEISDTVIQKNISKGTREKELTKIWSKFFSSKVVITDRLHGMIFAVITKTPCIVIRNSDHKIIESYKWIKDLNYIKLIDNFSYDNIEKSIGELSSLKELDKTNLKEEYFNKLIIL